MKNNLAQYKILKDKVKEKAVKRAYFEEMDKLDVFKDPQNQYFGKFEEYAVEHLEYYSCVKCADPYFGGLKQCGGPQNEPQQDVEEVKEEAKLQDMEIDGQIEPAKPAVKAEEEMI
jgi:hypothetical protein